MRYTVIMAPLFHVKYIPRLEVCSLRVRRLEPPLHKQAHALVPLFTHITIGPALSRTPKELADTHEY